MLRRMRDAGGKLAKDKKKREKRERKEKKEKKEDKEKGEMGLQLLFGSELWRVRYGFAFRFLAF